MDWKQTEEILLHNIEHVTGIKPKILEPELFNDTVRIEIGDYIWEKDNEWLQTWACSESGSWGGGHDLADRILSWYFKISENKKYNGIKEDD